MAKEFPFPVVQSEHVLESEALLIGTDAFDPPESEDPEAWLIARVVKIEGLA